MNGDYDIIIIISSSKKAKLQLHLEHLELVLLAAESHWPQVDFNIINDNGPAEHMRFKTQESTGKTHTQVHCVCVTERQIILEHSMQWPLLIHSLHWHCKVCKQRLS